MTTEKALTKHPLVLTCATLALSGCNPIPRAVNQSDAQQLADKITYIKDQHGLCYAMLATASYGANNVASIANVPCDKVGL